MIGKCGGGIIVELEAVYACYFGFQGVTEVLEASGGLVLARTSARTNACILHL